MPGISAYFVFALATAIGEPVVTPNSHLRPAAALPMTWRIERRIDAASGVKSCGVVTLGGNVSVLFTVQAAASVKASVRIGFDNEPGSLRYLRVNRKIFQTDKPYFTGPQAADIVARLKSPGEFSFEWEKQPAYGKQTGLFGTGDFTARAEECTRWLGGMRASAALAKDSQLF